MTSQENYDLKQRRKYASDLAWCDSIIFVYPTYWYSFPAILKGFFDRVCLPHVAFNLPPSVAPNSDKKKTNELDIIQMNHNVSPTPNALGLIAGLTNVRKIGCITSYGASWWIVNIVVGDCGRIFLSKAFRKLLHPLCTIFWSGFYNIHESTYTERERYLKTLYQ